jgi:hypothetical protein
MDGLHVLHETGNVLSFRTKLMLTKTKPLISRMFEINSNFECRKHNYLGGQNIRDGNLGSD